MVTTGMEEETEAGELFDDTEVAAATPTVVMAAAELVPATAADGLSVDLDTVVPLIIPPHQTDSYPLEVVTKSPPSDTQEAEGALSLAEPPTMASSGFSLPTPFPVGEPGNSEPPLYLDLTLTPTLMPTQDSQTEAGIPSADPEELLGPKEEEEEEEDIHAESAVQSENDTATFSASTVLSGDGEVDPAPQTYAHLLDTDSELDYQYDPADAFLPVSSAALLLLPLLLLKASATSQRSRLLTRVYSCPWFPAPPLLSDTCIPIPVFSFAPKKNCCFFHISSSIFIFLNSLFVGFPLCVYSELKRDDSYIHIIFSTLLSEQL